MAVRGSFGKMNIARELLEALREEIPNPRLIDFLQGERNEEIRGAIFCWFFFWNDAWDGVIVSMLSAATARDDIALEKARLSRLQEERMAPAIGLALFWISLSIYSLTSSCLVHQWMLLPTWDAQHMWMIWEVISLYFTLFSSSLNVNLLLVRQIRYCADWVFFVLVLFIFGFIVIGLREFLYHGIDLVHGNKIAQTPCAVGIVN